MKISRVWIVVVMLTAVALTVLPAQTARGDEIKIAVCNPLTAVTKSKEFRDYQEKATADHKTYDSSRGEREEKLKAMAGQLHMLTPNSPEYSVQNEAYLKASIEYDVWRKITELDLNRKEKNAIRALFDKVQAKCAEVAQQKGINLVISDRHADIPEDVSQIEMPQLQAAIMERSILYNDAKLDITQDVILAMDAAYAK